MSKSRSSEQAKRCAYLQAMGWSMDEVESLLACPSRELVDQIMDLLCRSSDARRMLRECKAYFPQAKIASVS